MRTTNPPGRGRRPVVSEGPRLGIDLGGTGVLVVVTGAGDEILAELEEPTGDHREAGPVLDRLSALVERALGQAGVKSSELCSAGAGVPGEVEPEAGVFRSSPILPTWRNVAVGPLLEQRTGIPFAIENDANAALLGEWALGAARQGDPVLLLTIGTGIGGALLAGGRLLRGHRGSAGEVGHLVVEPQGPACWCGRRGCLGMMASATALAEHYRRAAEGTPPVEVDGRLVARRFAEKDPAAQHAVARTASYLGLGIEQAACVLAPERVVFFGKVLEGLGAPLLDLVRRYLAERPYPAAIASLEIVAAELGSRAGAVGASLLGLPNPRRTRDSRRGAARGR